MSRKEVKGTIKTQVLSVFFLPLAVACIHTGFAFPIVSRLLAILQMYNTTLYIAGLICTIAVFAVFYTIIYTVTAGFIIRSFQIKPTVPERPFSGAVVMSFGITGRCLPRLRLPGALTHKKIRRVNVISNDTLLTRLLNPLDFTSSFAEFFNLL